MRDRYVDFGRRLKAILEDNNLSQLQVSRETGLSQQSVSQWVRGLHIPKGKRLSLLADYLGQEPRDLCPEAFDQEAVSLAQSNISWTPILGQPGWYVFQCRMPVDKEMLQELMTANENFEKRRQEAGFEDVKLK